MGIGKVVFVSLFAVCLYSTCTSQNVIKSEGLNTDISSDTDQTELKSDITPKDVNVDSDKDFSEKVEDKEHLVQAKEDIVSETDDVPKQDNLNSDIESNTEQDKPVSDTVSDPNKDDSISESDVKVPDTNVPDTSSKPEVVISDTGDEEEDAKDLTPEDEDMVILKMRELGGILDAKEIAEIVAEEEMLEDTEGNIPETEDLKFEPIPMPTDFDSYDRNGDDMIEMEELTEVTGAFENVADAFSVCDENGDGFIDREEFKKAPWDLSGKPPEGGLEVL